MSNVFRTIAQSSTDFPKGPTQQPTAWNPLNDGDGILIPFIDNLSEVGLNPTQPQNADGILIEPPISVPIPTGLQHEAINPPSPPEEPPVVLVVSHGF